MLEQRLYQSRLGKALSAAVLAGTLAFSSPAQADGMLGGGELGHAPPYLQLPARAVSEGIQPSRDTSYSNIDDDTEKKKGSDYLSGIVSLLVGLDGVVVGASIIEDEVCQSSPGQPDECNKTLNPLGLVSLIAGSGFSALGIYFLLR